MIVVESVVQEDVRSNVPFIVRFDPHHGQSVPASDAGLSLIDYRLFL